VRPPTTSSASCTTKGVLATWSLWRLAEQTPVVPVEEGNVGLVHRLVMPSNRSAREFRQFVSLTNERLSV
jgi:hypothetical protein